MRKQLNVESLTFSLLDLCNFFHMRRFKRFGTIGLLVLVLLLYQGLIVYKVMPTDGSSNIETSLSSWKLLPSQATKRTVPRMLIGIVSNANNHVGKVLRNRHRQLFGLWNDTRLCPYEDFLTSQNPNCQILYTFVLGAFNSTSDVSPILVDDSRPIQLDSIPIMPRYNDVIQNDVTILNIRENMNEGKTPTFLYWATQQAKIHDSIEYIVKCDSDTMLRYAFLLRMMHKELPWNPARSTVLGAIRHKAIWNETTGDESFWEQTYFHGMHLYLGGQFFLMSMDLALAVVSQAQNYGSRLKYLEGHEDHDTLSMMQVGSPDAAIRWIGMPKNYRFWEHPVKGEYRWERIWKREVKNMEQGLGPRPHYSVSQISGGVSSSLLVVLGATTKEKRHLYRAKLVSQTPKACNIILGGDPSCDIYYLFVIGGNPNGPSESIAHPESLVIPRGEDDDVDLVSLNIRDNVHEGMGQSILYYLQQNYSKKGSKKPTMDFVVICQSDWIVNTSKWLNLVEAQSSPHDLVIGDVRDKAQLPREFPVSADPFFHQFHDLHLYLGSSCLALSTTLVPKILEQASSNQEARDKYFENNLGHDLACLASMSPKPTVLHWIPITQTQQFWNNLE